MTSSLASVETMRLFDKLCQLFGATRGRGFSLQEIGDLFALSEALTGGDGALVEELRARLALEKDHLPGLVLLCHKPGRAPLAPHAGQ